MARTRKLLRRAGRRVARRARVAVSRAVRTGVSNAKTKAKARQRTLTLGGLTGFAFGLLQSRVDLPSIPGVPDTLTYGAAGVGIGLVTNSDTIIDCASGPLMAGLHHMGLHGFSDQVGGEYDEVGAEDEYIAGELEEPQQELAGEFDTVVAGDFDDI